MVTTASLRRQTSLLALLAFLFASLALVAVTTTPAYACGQILCDDTGGGGDPPGDGNGGGGGGGNPPGDGGDGGGTDGGGGDGGGLPNGDWSMSDTGFFPQRPPAQIGERGGTWTDHSRVFRYNGRCNGNYSWSAGGRSFSEPYIGWSWWLVGVNVPAHVMPGDEDGQFAFRKHATHGAYNCIRPPLYYEEDARCAVYAKGRIKGPYRNPNAATKTFRMPRKTTAFAKSGWDNPDLCDQSYIFTYGKNPKKWGQWELFLEMWETRCTRRVYITVDQRTGQVPAPEILNCSPAYKSDTTRAEAELFCSPPYVHKYWTNGRYTFTSADCDNGVTWSCGPNVNQDPTFAGVLNDNPIGVLDDGKIRRASWVKPSPQGDLRKVRSKKARLVFRGGSPRRSGYSVNDRRQPFTVSPNLDSWRSGWKLKSGSGSRTAWDVGFLAPGVAGDPWTARPEWVFTANFAFYAPRFVLDAKTGVLVYTLVKSYRKDTGKCVGREMVVDVHRARNTNG